MVKFSHQYLDHTPVLVYDLATMEPIFRDGDLERLEQLPQLTGADRQPEYVKAFRSACSRSGLP